MLSSITGATLRSAMTVIATVSGWMLLTVLMEVGQ
jgi:hypothetical protein